MVTLKWLPALAAFSQIADEDEPPQYASVAVPLTSGVISGLLYNLC